MWYKGSYSETLRSLTTTILKGLRAGLMIALLRSCMGITVKAVAHRSALHEVSASDTDSTLNTIPSL
ncbi:hypothetical protein E2C01_065958 [Portunus trituberculatus]|uniref:Uncharacterized protein n=1 Tax=Portunus trituberculatus TaxID=210409 RepID=A0A5B7HNI6_PORTR|nr:hypothetical protein [Portunus trituberculatus]